jgi:hypothetical protein
MNAQLQSTRCRLWIPLGAWLVCGLFIPAAYAADPPTNLREALLFHASFDGEVEADFAVGDASLYTAISEDEVRAGLQREDVTIAKGEGRHGDALRFAKKRGPVIFYQADRNMGFTDRNWNGTVSLWLSLDPDKELEPGYCDPIQITDKSALDASIFVEFSKDHMPRRFRLAVCPQYKEWNPTDREWESIPVDQRPLVEVQNPPFAHGKWTHVAITFENFNSGKANAVARLYLDGKLQGTVENRNQHYVWDTAKARIMLGLAYIGLYDDLSVFNRALTADEIQTLYELDGGVKSLQKQAKLSSSPRGPS